MADRLVTDGQAVARDETARDAELFGLDISSWDDEPDDGTDGVWPAHVDVVIAFLAVATQWRTASISGGMAPGAIVFVGLDYAGAKISLDAAGIVVTPAVWGGLQVMEAEARSALNGR